MSVPKEQRWAPTPWEGCQVLMVPAFCQEQAATSVQGFILTAWPGNIPASRLHGAAPFYRVYVALKGLLLGRGDLSVGHALYACSRQSFLAQLCSPFKKAAVPRMCLFQPVFLSVL